MINKNKTMKKSYFLLISLILLFVCGKSYAQMQGINASSERFAQNLKTLGEFVKVEKIDDNHILTLIREDSSLNSLFIKTDRGSHSLTTTMIQNQGFVIYDFKYYNGSVYFCGSRGVAGFVAWANIDDIIHSGQFRYELLSTTTVAYNLEVFVNNSGTTKVAVLGYNSNTLQYSFIDYNVWSSGAYSVYETPLRLQNITQTSRYIVAVASLPIAPYTEFGIIKHEKTNISNCIGVMFRFAYGGKATGDLFNRLPEFNKPSYLIEWVEDSSNVMVATCIDQVASPNLTTGKYPIALFNINIENFNIYATQIIPNDGKPYVKDMVYMPYDETMHLIVNGQLGNSYSTVPTSEYMYTDFIQKIHVWANMATYPSETYLPYSIIVGEDILNSITRYDSSYYVIGGKFLKNNNELYWFDRKADNFSMQCYKIYDTQVFYDPPQPIGSIINYSTTNSFSSNLQVGTFISNTGMYKIICSQ